MLVLGQPLQPSVILGSKAGACPTRLSILIRGKRSSLFDILICSKESGEARCWTLNSLASLAQYLLVRQEPIRPEWEDLLKTNTPVYLIFLSVPKNPDKLECCSLEILTSLVQNFSKTGACHTWLSILIRGKQSRLFNILICPKD
jgi:hypothetical protein